MSEKALKYLQPQKKIIQNLLWYGVHDNNNDKFSDWDWIVEWLLNILQPQKAVLFKTKADHSFNAYSM